MTLPRPSTPPPFGSCEGKIWTKGANTYRDPPISHFFRCMFCDSIWEKIDGVWMLTDNGKDTCKHP